MSMETLPNNGEYKKKHLEYQSLAQRNTYLVMAGNKASKALIFLGDTFAYEYLIIIIMILCIM